MIKFVFGKQSWDTKLETFTIAQAIESGVCKVSKETIVRFLNLNGYSEGDIFKLPYHSIEVINENRKAQN